MLNGPLNLANNTLRRKMYFERVKPTKSWPRGMTKVRSVCLGTIRQGISFGKVFKRTETFLDRQESDELTETSLELKLKYFYSPYNRTADFNKCMKFEPEEDEVVDTKNLQPNHSSNRKSQWKRLSKMIFKGDEKIFKKMVRTIKKRGFKKTTLRSPRRPINGNHSSKKFKYTFRNRLSSHDAVKEVDEKSRRDSVTPHETSENSKNYEFSSYFRNFWKLVKSKEGDLKAENKPKFRVKRKPRILISKFSSKLSLNKLIHKDTLKQYRSSKNKNMSNLESVLENCRSPLNSSKESLKLSQTLDKPRFLSPVLKTRKPLWAIEELKTITDGWNDITQLMIKRPTLSPKIASFKAKDVKRRTRYFSPQQKLVFAYGPDVIHRRHRSKKLSAKMPQMGKPIVIRPVKNKPSSVTVTTNHTSNFQPNSSKSIGVSPHTVSRIRGKLKFGNCRERTLS